jgi:CGNR zinc finger protein/putative stress-induced transcription regulator
MSRVGPREPGTVGLEARRSIADVIWVANTRHGPGGHWFARVTRDDGDHDHLGVPVDAVRYLADHRVDVPAEPPSPRDLAELAAIREMVRALLDPAASWTPGVLGILSGTRFAVGDDRRLAAVGAGWAAFIGDLILPLLEVVRLRDSLAICGNPVCRLVFLDESRSGTRRWCDDAGCGNRDRVKRRRGRLRAADISLART